FRAVSPSGGGSALPAVALITRSLFGCSLFVLMDAFVKPSPFFFPEGWKFAMQLSYLANACAEQRLYLPAPYASAEMPRDRHASVRRRRHVDVASGDGAAGHEAIAGNRDGGEALAIEREGELEAAELLRVLGAFGGPDVLGRIRVARGGAAGVA